jgi:hypothetical protein
MIAKKVDVRATGEENHNEDWYEEDAEQRQSIRQVHKSSTLAAEVRAVRVSHGRMLESAVNHRFQSRSLTIAPGHAGVNVT